MEVNGDEVKKNIESLLSSINNLNDDELKELGHSKEGIKSDFKELWKDVLSGSIKLSDMANVSESLFKKYGK